MDQIKNPFDESITESNRLLSEAQDPFNDASDTIKSNNNIITELVETDISIINTTDNITDKCQPKPEFPQGVFMQTQGQPFIMPGAPPDNSGVVNPGQVPPNNGGFAPQEGFNPSGGFAPQQNPGFAPQQNPGFNPQPNQGGGFPQQNHGGGFPPQNNNQNSGPAEKFAIVDMFWLVNKKLYANQPLVAGEAQLLTVGFNASFNNMRIGMCSDKGGAFTDSSIIIQNCERLANFNIFSEHALQILYIPGNEIRIFERVIRAGSWSPNVSSITNNGNTFVIKSTNPQNGNVTSFIVADEQVIGFTKALEFLLNGQSWNMALTGTLNR